MFRGSFSSFVEPTSSRRRKLAKKAFASFFDDVSSMAYSNFNTLANGSEDSTVSGNTVAVSNRIEDFTEFRDLRSGGV